MNDTNMDPQTLRQNILSATRHISELAQIGAWHETLELVGQRQRLLETFFSAVGNRDHKEELIHAVQAADRLLGDLASAARQDTLTELDGHLHRRKALGVYEAASRSVKSD